MKTDRSETTISRYQYSLGVGFAGSAGIFGVASFASTKYLSTAQEIFIVIFIWIVLLGVTGLLLSIFLKGFCSIGSLGERRIQLESLSRNLFDIGMLAVLDYLPAFILCGIPFLVGFLIFPEHPLVPTLLGIVSAIFTSFLIIRFYPPETLVPANHKPIILLLATSALLLIVIYDNSYKIVIDEETHVLNGEEICLITIRATGFASINAMKHPQLQVYSYRSGQIESIPSLSKVDEEFYLAFFPISDFKSGIYIVEYQSKVFLWRDFREYKLLVVED